MKTQQMQLDIDDSGEIKNFDKKYTQKITVPHYEPSFLNVTIQDLYKTDKRRQLSEQIYKSGVSEEEKEFLIAAAHRHDVFNYKMIAEYYVKASDEMKELMEQSGLVIIDINNAIANGYVRLNKRIGEMIGDK